MPEDPHERFDEMQVRVVFDDQRRLTRRVARCMLVFALFWILFLALVPPVLHQGAIASLLIATFAAIIVTVVMENAWMLPRAREKERLERLPPPPAPPPR